ncbi:MAG: class I SAM-dependent methyltransferase [Tissierellia bacterium]|nr:class I SAM-dependent methyltransferase [Tissierellia bacterium]
MEQGHEFLARLGKTKLRPGGMEGTGWILDQAELTPEKKVLEVGCNMGVNLIKLAQTYHCNMEGVDRFEPALDKARKAIQEHALDAKIHVQKADARKLPFEDESFDIVINEAMLTMLATNSKVACLKEYFRVLKPGGMLLTHDVCMDDHKSEHLRELREILKISVHPLDEKKWTALYEEAGFSEPKRKVGKLIFLRPKGLIRDEGLFGFLKIMLNGLKKKNFARFKSMRKFFRKHQDGFHYIVMAGKKPE